MCSAAIAGKRDVGTAAADGNTGSLVAGTEVAEHIGLLVLVAAVGAVVVVAAVGAVAVAVRTIQAASLYGLHPPQSVLPTTQDRFAPALIALHSPPPKHLSSL